MSLAVSLKSAQPELPCAIALTRGAVDLHAGIFYRCGESRGRVLHLEFHYKLTCDERVDTWTYVPPQIDPIELSVLAGFCELVRQVRPRIPYGLRSPTSRFNDEGAFVPGEDETGLTCTTFVLKLFEWARIPLVDLASWQTRPDDVDAQRALVAFLRGRATNEHVAAVEADVGCMRLRCEEIAAASAMAQRPVQFANALEPAARVRASFEVAMSDAMPVRIGFLGWGSLIWNPGPLKTRTKWVEAGPRLPVEFSRVSSDQRLTLVIDTAAGVPIATFFSLGGYGSLNEAIEGLRTRERTNDESIGFIDLKNGARRAQDPTVAELIRTWAEPLNLDAVVWTDLRPNFEEVLKTKFSVEAATAHVFSLKEEKAKKALEYIERAPRCVETPVRSSIRAELTKLRTEAQETRTP